MRSHHCALQVAYHGKVRRTAVLLNFPRYSQGNRPYFQLHNLFGLEYACLSEDCLSRLLPDHGIISPAKRRGTVYHRLQHRAWIAECWVEFQERERAERGCADGEEHA